MLNRIEQRLEDLSRAEKSVAAWVLAHPQQALNSTLASVARQADVSEPTVVRFCRSVGLSGFSELKLRLAESLSRRPNYLHRDLGPGDGPRDAVMKVMDRSIQAIMEARDLCQSMPFQAAIDAMAQARQWVFGGLGASGFVAQDAWQKFFRLGVPCSAQTDTPSIAQCASVMGKDDVLLMISHSGRWEELALAAQQVRRQGGTVVMLTQPGSVMALEATILFDCVTREDTSVYTPMSSRLAQLALLDALQVALALELGDTADTNLRRSKLALAGL